MRLLLLSDIHANLEALEACLAVVPAHDCMMNLGDVVGYNASPNEVCERVRAMGCPVVRGNHDRACAGLSDLSEFNLVAAMSARWTQITLQPDHVEWLRSLPQGPVQIPGLAEVQFVHGSPIDEDEYLVTLHDALAPLSALPVAVTFFGHTHLQGGHQATVRRGLEFLLNAQDAEGCLAGTTNKYERMYCHAMAACALSEAFAMTADKRLQHAVRNAVRYTVRAQDRASGGWRYQPSEPGDTSQLGWQLMSLKSAELAGIPILPETRDGVVRRDQGGNRRSGSGRRAGARDRRADAAATGLGDEHGVSSGGHRSYSEYR